PLLPQGPCRRRRQCPPYRRRLQPAPHPRLAEDLVVPHPDSAHTSLHHPVSAQISLLTDDCIVSHSGNTSSFPRRFFCARVLKLWLRTPLSKGGGAPRDVRMLAR